MLQPKAYSKEKQKVYDVKYIDFDNETLELLTEQQFDFYAHVYDFDEVEFMENTGMKDKNGNYIYEGDIVTVNGTWDCIVQYNQSNCVFVLKSIDSRWNIRWSMGYLSNYDDIAETLEVIGNIYENKELVE